MKTLTIHALAATLLLGLTVSTFAQDIHVADERETIINTARRQANDEDLKHSMMRSFWDGNNLIAGVPVLLHQGYIREGFGISEEQGRKIEEVSQYIFTTFRINDPEYSSLRREWNNCDLTTAEGRERYIELQKKMRVVISEKEVSLIKEHLTPEQIRRVQEFHIATMSIGSFVSPTMFEALDLSDDQKKQLDAIRQEIEPEFEKYVIRQVAVDSRSNAKNVELADELKTMTDQAAKERLISDTTKRIWVELQPEQSELRDTLKDLTNNLNSRMFDVLTDAQWMRLQDLIDNPPDYVKRWIARYREYHEAMERNNASTGTWIPGPGAWQPGSSVIPEQYRQERNSRFPRGENPSP